MTAIQAFSSTTYCGGLSASSIKYLGLLGGTLWTPHIFPELTRSRNGVYFLYEIEKVFQDFYAFLRG